MQSTNHILLVRPVASAFNTETATSNAFQRKVDVDDQTALRLVQAEFDAFASKLRSCGVDVEVVEDTISPAKPDAVFPNNWIRFIPMAGSYYTRCTPEVGGWKDGWI